MKIIYTHIYACFAYMCVYTHVVDEDVDKLLREATFIITTEYF
jgi:hypothetical protein